MYTAIMARYPQRLSIRRMRYEDLEEVVEIEHLCGLSPWQFDGYEKELSNPDALVCVAARTDNRAATSYHAKVMPSAKRIEGFLAARVVADEVHITNIAVRHEARRYGIGTRLLAEAVLHGLTLGAKYLVLEVRAANQAALRFYEQHGFYEVGRRKNYYQEPDDDAILMNRVL